MVCNWFGWSTDFPRRGVSKKYSIENPRLRGSKNKGGTFGSREVGKRKEGGGLLSGNISCWFALPVLKVAFPFPVSSLSSSASSSCESFWLTIGIPSLALYRTSIWVEVPRALKSNQPGPSLSMHQNDGCQKDPCLFLFYIAMVGLEIITYLHIYPWNGPDVGPFQILQKSSHWTKAIQIGWLIN